jgi:hypothetical protein
VSHAFSSAALLQLDALTREMENGRLFRLVSKLAFVTDRNSSDVGAASGDTGNSYLLQLFRDFVFHQGERDGGRVIDWGHIVENLNKVRKAGGARDASQGVLGTTCGCEQRLSQACSICTATQTCMFPLGSSLVCRGAQDT